MKDFLEESRKKLMEVLSLETAERVRKKHASGFKKEFLDEFQMVNSIRNPKIGFIAYCKW